MRRPRSPVTTADVASVAVVVTLALIHLGRDVTIFADGFVTRHTRPACAERPRGSPSSFPEGDWPFVISSTESIPKIYLPPTQVPWKRHDERISVRRVPGRSRVGRGSLPREGGVLANETAVEPPTGTAVLLDGAECTDSRIPTDGDGESSQEKEKCIESHQVDQRKNDTKTAAALAGKKGGKKSISPWRSFFNFGLTMKGTGSGNHSGDDISSSGGERRKMDVQVVDQSNNSAAITETMVVLENVTSPTKGKASKKSMSPWPSFLSFGRSPHGDGAASHSQKISKGTDAEDKDGFLGVKTKPFRNKASADRVAKANSERKAPAQFSGDGESLGLEQIALGNSNVIGPNSTKEKAATTDNNVVGEPRSSTKRSSVVLHNDDSEDATVVASTSSQAVKKANAEGARAKFKSKTAKGAVTKVGLDDEGMSLGGIDPTAPLTLSDLDTILRSRGYVHRSEMALPDGRKSESKDRSRSSSERNVAMNDGENFGALAGSGSSSKKAGSAERGGVAFPQPSVLSYHDVAQGTIVASMVLGVVLGSSVNPNLWLVGCVLGVMYGQSLGKTDPNDDRGAVGNAVTNVGRKIAKSYLNVHDMIQTLWFMYRTGQLSYEYYRRYEAMDQRFHIQDKMDAWNARFVEGKRKFDEWEKENEVGRRALAGLRTFWLVNEKSYKKQMKKKPKSKYRIIQIILDALDWLKRFALALWRAVTGGDGGTDLRELLKGIRIQVSEDTDLGGISRRAGSAVAALVAVNAIGAVFAISPTLLGALAVAVGVLWPDWVGEVARRVGDNMDETRARGRGEKLTSKQPQTTAAAKHQQGKEGGTVKFHYFLRQDGSKRWYRTGQPVFPWMKVEEEESTGLFDLFRSADKKPKQRKEETRWWANLPRPK